jgi:ABC-2 type transport system ATP-binding protein
MLHLANDARKHIAYVPEQPAVYGHLSAIENMRYFLSLSNIKATNSEIESYLIQVGLKSTIMATSL